MHGPIAIILGIYSTFIISSFLDGSAGQIVILEVFFFSFFELIKWFISNFNLRENPNFCTDMKKSYFIALISPIFS